MHLYTNHVRKVKQSQSELYDESLPKSNNNKKDTEGQTFMP